MNQIKLNPQIDEYWVARIRYWPNDKERLIIIKIYQIDKEDLLFFPVFTEGNKEDLIWSQSCAHFELIGQINWEEYK